MTKKEKLCLLLQINTNYQPAQEKFLKEKIYDLTMQEWGLLKKELKQKGLVNENYKITIKGRKLLLGSKKDKWETRKQIASVLGVYSGEVLKRMLPIIIGWYLYKWI